MVGILYASGYSPDELQSVFEKVDQSQLYGRDSEDGPALLGLAGARKWLDQVVGERTFAALRIPCAVTAVDTKTGGEVILSEGRLKDAILATIALPGVFPPHRLGDMELMDGGVLDPVPVSVARMLSPDLPVVAVTLNDPMDKPMRPYIIPIPNVVPRQIAERITRMHFAQAYDIFMRAVDINSRAMAHFRLQMEAPDVIIRPNVHEIDLLQNVVVADVVKLGEQAVEEVLPQLKRATSWGQRVKKIFLGKRP
jgi:NTE family protein